MTTIPATQSLYQSWFLSLKRKSTKVQVLWTAHAGILFYLRGKTFVPIAVQIGPIVYFHANPGPERRAINEFSASTQSLVDGPRFDFLLSQVLTTAGLLPTKVEA